MNRFKSYLDSQKLAKMLLLQAREELEYSRMEPAIRDLIKAVEYQMTACNNIASLHFESRKKR